MRIESHRQSHTCEFFVFCLPHLYLWGSPFWVRSFAYVTVFESNHCGSHIPSSWMVHAWWGFFFLFVCLFVCLFVLFCFCFLFLFFAGIHPSRTWTSGSFESVRWSACVHRLDLGLYSHPKEFVWDGVKREGSLPSEKFSSEEDRTHDAASSLAASPTHYQRAIPTPTHVS